MSTIIPQESPQLTLDFQAQSCPAALTPSSNELDFTSPRKGKIRLLTAYGEEKNMRQWSQDPRCVISIRALVARLKEGWEPERALSTPRMNAWTYLNPNAPHKGQLFLTAFGETKSVQKWAVDSRCRVTIDVLRRRNKAGLSDEDAITMPGRSFTAQERRIQKAIARENRKTLVTEGETYGKWTVCEDTGFLRNCINQSKTKILCRCQCGTVRRIVIHTLRAIKTGGCPKCRDGEGYHGFRKERTYSIWASMIQRCHNDRCLFYVNYGGRGISVCKEWMRSFLTFREWALNNGYADELSLERVDVNGNYEPSNCTWATTAVQANNKRSTIRITALGETKSAAEWARDPRCLVTDFTLRSRIKMGWDAEYSITTPPHTSTKGQLRTRILKHSD